MLNYYNYIITDTIYKIVLFYPTFVEATYLLFLLEYYTISNMKTFVNQL